MLVQKCDMSVGNKFHCKVLKLTPKAEHTCVGGYAGAEVFGFHGAMWWLSVGIVLFYLGSLAYGLLTGHAPPEDEA